MVSLEKTSGPERLTALILTFFLCFCLAGSSPAQSCGDLDMSGIVDITDASVLADYLLMTHTPLSNPEDADVDGVPGVTLNDLVTFLAGTSSLDCSVNPDTFFQHSADTVKFRGSSDLHPGSIISPHVVEIWLNAVDDYRGLSLPLSWESNATYCSLDSITASWSEIDSENNRLLLVKSYGTYPAGEHLLARLHFSLAGFILWPAPAVNIIFDTTSYPPGHTTVLSRDGVGDRIIDGFLPVFFVDPNPVSCCRGITGNVDCDGNDIVDVTDIQALIDHLFLTLSPLCCEQEANFNYPGSGYAEMDDIIDVTDLSILIDNQFLTLSPLPVCP